MPPRAGGARGRLDLVRHPVLRRIFVANAMVAFGWDVHTIFVPIYGNGIGLSGVEIGAILSTFAAATFVVRFAIGRIVRYASEARVLSVALITAGVVYAVLPLTDSVVWLAALSFVLGLGLGAGQPTVLSLLHAHAPPGRVGEAAGVRISMIQAMAVGGPAGVRCHRKLGRAGGGFLGRRCMPRRGRARRAPCRALNRND
jgi:MFS family permease